MKRVFGLIFACVMSLGSTAADTDEGYVIDSFWTNWYLEAGLDMSLQNPYGHDFFGGVFPNGKTFGLNVAMLKQVTPAVGMRLRGNWENGIGLLKNNHDNWLAPFYQPGENRRKGGYVTFVGDLQLDIHNIFWGYKPERKWNMQVFSRAGGAYNFGVSKGTPLIGLGIGNTFRLNDKLAIYFDVAYNMVSSGFTGVEKNTGTGSNSNGFFDISVGVKTNVSKTHGFRKATREEDKDKVLTKAWGKEWYLQFGMDMSLQNPYGKDFFGGVFPNGKTFGVDVAVVKRFTPQVAVRAKVNWENGIPLFENHHLTWIGPADNPSENMDKGGCLFFSADIPLSIKNILSEIDPERKWDPYVFPRFGLGCNLAIGSSSPCVGAGAGTTYKLNDRWSLYADMAYQVITSEFTGGAGHTGMSVAAGSNGFMDINIGAQLRIGK